ncbi:chitin deacetylase 1-like [Physella acuta]|uniref:chitin deacetylase 1-like n=1 Tax=Physella acuta TaxID=109671 RepID=UPI0027DB2C2B|nr:chitin deacetylase 1-like [Physella acuta]
MALQQYSRLWLTVTVFLVTGAIIQFYQTLEIGSLHKHETMTYPSSVPDNDPSGDPFDLRDLQNNVASHFFAGLFTLMAGDSDATISNKSQITGCNSSTCQPPSCRCQSNQHPGNFPLDQVPMMVLLTFDDSVGDHNIHYFKTLTNIGIRSANNCPMKMTFFVCGLDTNYTHVRLLHQLGHEIGVHSVTHNPDQLWWSRKATAEDYINEFGNQKKNLMNEAGIPESDLRGMRVPYLQAGGDTQMGVMEKLGLIYDSSYVMKNGEGHQWPFTLDFTSVSEYSGQVFPRGRYPGIWEIPLSMYKCVQGNKIIEPWMPDGCRLPKSTSAVLEYLRTNFKDRYQSRSPMQIFIHYTWFTSNSQSFEGLVEFLKELARMPDIWFLSLSQHVEWMASPTPISRLKYFTPWKC